MDDCHILEVAEGENQLREDCLHVRVLLHLELIQWSHDIHHQAERCLVLLGLNED